MTEMLVFDAEIKNAIGKGAARALRRQNRIPAIVYGGADNVMLSVAAKEFVKEYGKGNIQSRIVKLDFNDKSITVIPRAVQINPVTDFPEHIDFQEIVENTEVKISVPVRVLNTDKCPGIKKGGMMNVAHRTISFYCHPSTVPTHIAVDVADLEMGQNVHIMDIALPDGIKPVDLHNFVILSISGRSEEKEGETANESGESK